MIFSAVAERWHAKATHNLNSIEVALNVTKDRLPLALLVLRLGIFLVLIVWTLGKFIHPAQAISIYDSYYGMRLGRSAVYALGVMELAVALAFVAGVWKRAVRAVVMAMVATTVMAPAGLYLHPYMDHILLFFAFWTMLAGSFALYYLRDLDVKWSAGNAPGEAAAQAMRRERLPLALLLLRVSVAIALGMWCAGKFINPTQTTRILAHFYSVKGLNFLSAYGIGILQAAVILAFLVGAAKRLSYGLILLLDTPGVLAPWAQYLHPYQGHVILFLGSVPMWAACFALYSLREDDVLGVVSGRRMAAPVRVDGRPVFIAVAIAILFAAYFGRVSARKAALERERGPAMIALVQKHFEPSPKLLAMHPTGEPQWVATANAVDCKYQRPQIPDCWEVYFGANVEGPDPSGRKPGKAEADFIIAGDTMRIVEAMQPGIFVRKQP